MRPYRWRLLRWAFLLWWRWRERDVDDVYETTGSKSLPDYPNGKVSGLRPDLKVTTETTESPWVCCGYCSAAMACRAARSGLSSSMSGTAHPIRSQGGRPHDNGARASELRDGAKRAHGVTLEALARSEIPERLRAGYAVVVNLDYAELPGWAKTQGGSFGHSAALFGWREDGDYVGYMDPLWAQDARGAWMRWSDLKPALWADGEHSGTVVKYPPPEPEPEPVPAPPPPCPPCPPPEVTVDDVDAAARAAEATATATTRLERDRAWRWYSGLEQPRLSSTWAGSPDLYAVPGSSWSRFSRFAPELPDGTWNGPDATFDRTRWA